MKRLLIVISLSVLAVSSYAQIDEHSIDYELGKGLNIISNGGKQQFNFGGYIQAEGKYSHIPDDNPEKRFGIKRVYLNTSGKILDDKFSYMIQMDLTKSYPLLDAWAAYHPTKNIKISVGQKQSFSGPRSMMYFDQTLPLADRSLADTTFFNDGRELGLFVETRNSLGSVGLDLAAAVTSGDGKNSFGSSSTDFDLGGAKYTGRATLFPLGFFTGYNDYRGADFAREKTVKIALGTSYSYNVGASDKIGEGHGTISLYDTSGKFNFPDYQKLSVDFLLKYRGFTFLSEYINAVANNLEDIYVQPSVNAKLQPKQIANYMVLGNGLNFEAGYLFKNNWAIDARYSTVMPEWEENTTLIQKTNEYTGGISKYFKDNRIKLQLLGSIKQMPNNAALKDLWHAGFVAHVVL